MSERARKAGQFAGAVERLAVELAMVEIIQARRFLGKPTSKKDREELLKLTTPSLPRQPRHSEPPYTFGNRWR